jgi:hypothetical protein
MTEQELRIARLSKIMNSGLLVPTGHTIAHTEAQDRVISSLEKSLESEKIYNVLQQHKRKLLEQKEKELKNLKESINRHHFNVLKKQIEEKKRNQKIYEKYSCLINKAEENHGQKSFKIKEILDAQVEEKKRIKEEKKKQEDALDRYMIDLAIKSLDNEMKNKFEGKKILQNQLRESWEKTQNTNRLQKAIQRSRQFEDNITDIDKNSNKRQNSMSEALRHYERYARKIEDKQFQDDFVANKIENKSFSKPAIREKKSRSLVSNHSGLPDKRFLEKLEKLNAEQDKIKAQKIEVINFLESRGHSNFSSRPASKIRLLEKLGN